MPSSALSPEAKLHQDVLDYFEFWPSHAASIVALVLMFLAGTAVLVITVRTRAWFMLIATIVAYLEVVGFGLRLDMFNHPVRGVYITMQCLLIIPPSFLALIDYMALGKLVALIQVTKPPGTKFTLKPKFITWIFFGLEIASLAAQGAGAGLSVGGNTGPPVNAGAGKGLLIAGLVTLVVLIAFFLCTTIYVQRNPQMQVPECRPTMRLIFLGLYATTILLLIRNTFRVVEFSNGWYGWIARHEVFFYVFDSLIIFSWLCVMVPLHFGINIKRLQQQTAPLAQNTDIAGKGFPGGHNVVADSGVRNTEMV
ncbi:hypothetical protein WJX73_004916 [Symbiochloris irregularis]|uniref:Uncharacterized protein n=1 Tax=Symbiochloris irregularis TaxID=706552 RepID=A0AAW1NMR8_9CHLO